MSLQFDEELERALVRFIKGFLTALLIVFISGCGQETVAIPAAIFPRVVSATPAQGVIDVPLNTTISATFSVAMNPATINGASFTLAGPGGAPVTGTIVYVTVGSVATFTPTLNLAPSTTFTATITTGARDQEDPSNSLAAKFVWTFTTAAAPGTTPPTVVSTIPVNGGTGVPINQVLSPTFSEPMNPASVNATTFTVTGPGGAAITGVVTYLVSGAVARFTPSAQLAYNTTYTATVTTGETDLAGNALTSNYVWTFTTATAPDTTPPRVISTIPVNGSTGVPISQVLSASFSEPMNPATINGETLTVTGPGGVGVTGAVAYVTAGSVATFAPAAPLAYNTTYTATVTTGETDLAGNALTSNYVWTLTTATAPDTTPPTVVSTIPANAATGVAINQPVSATFSEAMNCATLTSPATTFTVMGPGATTVAGTVNCTASIATFTPTALLATNSLFTATITTAATDLAGNALASAFAWSFRTVPAPTLPTVISVVPVNGGTSVAINQALSATFSEAMNPATINVATFTLTGPGGVGVTGAVTYVAAGSVATFTPAANLASSTVYTATITTGTTDLAGDALANNFIWTFTTAAAPDTTPPTVISTIPVNGAANVPFNQAVSITFSEAMNPATISSTTFNLAGPGGTAIAGLVTYATIGNAATFTPTADLAPGTVFTATVTTGATDLAGNALVSNYVWTFTTGAAPDTTPPTVVSTIPVGAAMGVPINQAVSATFSEAMNPLTITSATFQLAAPGGALIAATIAYDPTNFIITLTPSTPLAYNTTYTATVTTGETDLAGNALTSNYVWTFTTSTAPDTTPPTVVSTIPANAATGVAINQPVTATFSEAMNPATIDATTFMLTGPGGVGVTGAVTYVAAGSVATFAPAAPLAYNTTYTATVTTGETDLAGNALTSNYVWTFTTATAPDTTPPTVVSTIPADAATGVAINQPVSATFSEAMNCATLTSPATTFTVMGPGATTVAGTVNCTASIATFTPTALLATNSLFTATITTAATDLAGNALASAFAWSFRTVPAPTLPTVISVVPVNGGTSVAINQALSATFSEAMNPATINVATFTLTGPGGVGVTGAVTYVAAGSVATFTPAANLASSTVYTATITTGTTDLAGDALANNFIWTFTTAAAPDTTPPTVISTIPVNGAANVPFNQAVSITFSEAMNPATISSTTFNLAGPGGTAIAGLVTYATIGNAATFTPTADLAPGTVFTATVTTGATDLAGNALVSNYVWTFTTGAAPDTTPPTVVSTIPVGAAMGVPINQAVSATFSEAMNPLTITSATFQLAAPGGALIAATIAYDPTNFIITLTPSTPLAYNTTYTATITTGETDLAGNALTSNYVWTFTTAVLVLPPPVDLGTASLFGAFGGGAGITNQGTSTVVNGDIGTTGASTLITGFHDNGPGCIYTETPLNIGMVNGTIETAPPPPTISCPNEGTTATSDIAANAAADALAAYGTLVAWPGGLDVSTCLGCGGGSAGELGGERWLLESISPRRVRTE